MSVCSRFPLPQEEGRLELCQPHFPRSQLQKEIWLHHSSPWVPRSLLGLLPGHWWTVTCRRWPRNSCTGKATPSIDMNSPVSVKMRHPSPVFPSRYTLPIPEMQRPVQLRQNSIQLVGRNGWINRRRSHNPPHLSIQRGMSTAHRPDCDGLLQASTKDLLKAAAVVLEDRILQEAPSSTEPHRHLSWQAKNEIWEKRHWWQRGCRVPRHEAFKDSRWPLNQQQGK